LDEVFGGGHLPYLIDIVPDGQGQATEHFVVSGTLTFRENGRFKLSLVTSTNCFVELTGEDCGFKTQKYTLQGTYSFLFSEFCGSSPTHVELTEQDGRQWGGFFYTVEDCPDPNLPLIDMSGGTDFAPFAPSASTWSRQSAP
jgi:hypothetical protein